MSSPTDRAPENRIRIGIDLGGTKIEGVGLDAAGRELCRLRIAAPRHDYGATIHAIAGLVAQLWETSAKKAARTEMAFSVGIGMPGSISPATKRVQNANSTWLNGQPFGDDLETALSHPVRLANDANCFAMSEAVDGAARDAHSVFGVILGTGVGGGLVIDGRIVDGPRGTGGEWGHNPLPWAAADEFPGPRCWCGKHGCIEAWVSGPALSADHQAKAGVALAAERLVAMAHEGDCEAVASLERHCGRLARGLAHVINIIDPDVVVLGGGLSNMAHLYSQLPQRIAPYLFTDAANVRIVAPRWGDAGGVRGAAWLWD